MEDKLRSVYSKLASVLGGVSVVLTRLFLVAVVIPSTVGMLILAAATGWSFNGAALVFAETIADSQQVDKVPAPGHFLIKHCIEPNQSAERPPLPADAVCKDWIVQELAVSDWAASTGQALFGAYLGLFFFSVCFVIVFMPQSRLRIRERIGNDLGAIFNKVKASVSGKPAA